MLELTCGGGPLNCPPCSGGCAAILDGGIPIWLFVETGGAIMSGGWIWFDPICWPPKPICCWVLVGRGPILNIQEGGEKKQNKKKTS